MFLFATPCLSRYNALMTINPIIIIGTGLAGYTLAKEIRKIDKDVPLCLFSEDDGCFYSKPQLSATLAKGKLPDDLPLADVVAMRTQLNAEIHNYTTVSAVDTANKTVHVGEKSYAYSQCVFACGASVLPLPFKSKAENELLRVNNLEDYRRMHSALVGKKHIAIVGAGLVGTEFAVDLTSAGFTVDVIAMGEAPLDRFMPATCGKVVQEALAAHGVNWHLAQKVNDIHKVGKQFVIHTGEQTLEVDAVLIAIGIRPNIQLAAQAGVTVDKGIVSDDYCQTSAAHVYAVGDCAQMQGAVRNYTLPIFQAAKALAKTLCGDKTAVVLPVTPIITKTPCHPIVMVLPEQQQGEWQIEQAQAQGCKALYYVNDKLIGFILTGTFASERTSMLKLINNN